MIRRTTKPTGEKSWLWRAGPAKWVESHELAMRRAIVLSLLGALLPILPLPSPAAPQCSDSLSTADQTRCLIKALEASDRQLQQALMAVAKEAQQIPGGTFQTLWRDNLKGFYATSPDPMKQAEAFRANRRAVCAYAKSVGFQGTGYGITTTRCELALTSTLLNELKP
jgi:uncharacterized protein YecT (DUF1311 family)